MIDDLLWQEIFSLREKLKIAVAAIKHDNPNFDDREFTHRLNSVDFDQLMEELNGEAEKPAEDLFGSALMKDRRQEMVDKVAGGTYKKDDEDKMCEIIKGLDEEIPELEAWELNLCETYHVKKCAECGNKWISVKDRLSESGKPVLVFDGKPYPYVNNLTESKRWIFGSDLKITHWYPLPKNPNA